MTFFFLLDLTFTHEGNKTYLIEGLVNFEKMVKKLICFYSNHLNYYIFPLENVISYIAYYENLS